VTAYKREPKWAKELKKKYENQSHVVTITIEENGDQTFLNTKGSDIFLEIGQTKTQRASHVEPDALLPRLAFHLLRGLFGDKGRVAEWTRNWQILWRVNTKPVGGPILERRFWNRQFAIEHEVEFLDQFFFERTI